MKLFMLKFTHGVEVGAEMAYLGHYERTKDLNVLNIAVDESKHQKEIKRILKSYNTKPNYLIDFMFCTIGIIVGVLCLISPVFLLNKVATILEKFAVFSYTELAKKFPEYKDLLNEMEDTEQAHIDYFTLGKVQCEAHQRKNVP
jgi:rubrerythrin